MRLYGKKQILENPFKVLVHDDEQGVIDALFVVLKREGINNVKGITKTKDLLDVLSKENHDLLILDYYLKDTTADKIIPQIYQASRNLKIILLTGHKDTYYQAKSLAKLMLAGYVEKPNFETVVLNVLSIKNMTEQQERFEGSFGAKLAYIRKKFEYTQDQLAEKLNVSRTNIAAWENDKYKPNAELLPIIAEVLKIDLNWLLGVYSMENCRKVM